jgi:hypothetical protein
MLVVRGSYDGRELRLEKQVHLDREVPVVVTFLEPLPDQPPATNSYREFLLSGPALSSSEIEPFLTFIEGFRKWKV